MTELIDVLAVPAVTVLVDWSLRLALLIGGLMVWLRVCPPRSASARYWVCTGFLAVSLLVPIIPHWNAEWRITARPVGNRTAPEPRRAQVAGPTRRPGVAPHRPRSGVRPAPAVASAPAPQAPRAIEPQPARPAPEAPVASAVEVERPAVAEPFGAFRWLVSTVLGLWLAGALIVLARLALGHWLLRRLRTAAYAASREADARLGECARAIGLTRAIELRVHSAVASPLVLGGLRPAVIVPADWDDVRPEAQRACLLHELAHLARYDDLGKCVRELIRVPLYFHPLVRWLLARLDHESEMLCDEAAVQRGIDRHEFARTLLEFARRPVRLRAGALCAPTHALTFLNPRTTQLRITRLLEDDMARQMNPLSTLKVIGLSLAVLASAALVLGGVRVRAVEQAPAAKAQPPAVAKPDAPARPATMVAITGVVRDATDRPIPGALVLAGHHGEKADRQLTKTDANGAFRIDRQPADRVDYLAFKDGYAVAGGTMILNDPAQPPQALTIVLPKRGPVEGTVTDRAGKPFAGAEVRVEAGFYTRGVGMENLFGDESIIRGTPFESLLIAKADSEGRFRFTDLPAGIKANLRASAPGMSDVTRAENHGQSLFTADGAKPVKLVLAPEARVRGRITTRLPGVSVAGWTVGLSGVAEVPSYYLHESTTSDADGRFAMNGLGEGRANVFLDDMPIDGPRTFRAAKGITLTAGKDAEVEIEIIEGTKVEGRVTSSDGKPLVGVAVVASDPRNPIQSSSPNWVKTDNTGTYRFRLAPGDWNLSVAGRVEGYADGNASSSPSIQVAENAKELAGPTLALLPAKGLRGKIVDASGAPLADARIVGYCTVSFCTAPNVPPAVADADGAFELPTAASGTGFPINQAVNFRIELRDGTHYEVTSVTPASGEITLVVPTLLNPALKGPENVAPDELAGIVVDAKGTPLTGVTVDAWDWYPGTETTTDRNGRFRLANLGKGEKVEVQFRKTGYEPKRFFQQPTGQPGWVVVLGNQTYFEGTIRGPDGRPVPNALVRGDSGAKQMAGGMMSECWSETRSDKDGRYRFHVEPGRYDVQVRVPGVGVARQTETVSHGQSRVLDIKLTRGVDFIAHVVDHTTKKPVPGLRLWHWDQPGIEGRSNASGIVEIRDLMPGKQVFDVEVKGYARWWSDACVTPWARFAKADRHGFQRNFDNLDFEIKPGMSPVTITVEPAVTIRGQVVDPDGKPVAGATVAPALTGSGNSLTGDTRFSVETGKDGRFEALMPASGDVEYNLIAHDGKYGEWRRWANGVLPPMRTRPGTVIDNVTLALTRPATVTGRVVDALGKPVAEREVRTEPTDKLENRYYDPTTRTKADGTFELRFVRPGEHYVQCAPFWLYAQEAPEGTTRIVKLAAGETRTGVDLKAPPTP
jgi:beta-lactamase regulating signal transducer with metallopeptidase domain/protocatechuate 3,4-dioxygenase beta subunit